ncbi:MAG: hypothetical protein ABIS35_15745 [Terracoccus sp.]
MTWLGTTLSQRLTWTGRSMVIARWAGALPGPGRWPSGRWAGNTTVAAARDGLCTSSLAGGLAARLEPAVQPHLVAGKASWERTHAAVLRKLGL